MSLKERLDELENKKEEVQTLEPIEPPTPIKEEQEVKKKEFEDIPEFGGPLKVLEDIKERPTPKGMYPVEIGGRYIDLSSLENYIVQVSPHSVRTITRSNALRIMEESRNFSPPLTKRGFKGGLGTILLLIVGVAGLCVLGLFLPEIINFVTGMFGGF